MLYLGGYLLMANVRQEELVPVFAAARKAGARTVLDVVTPGPGDYPIAPDLVVEVDIHHDSRDNYPIYATLGVSEIWRYDGAAATIHYLKGNDYIEVEIVRSLLELHGVDDPIGPFQVNIAEERFLRLDADGGLHVSVTLSEPLHGGGGPGHADAAQSWTIEYVELEVVGRTTAK